MTRTTALFALPALLALGAAAQADCAYPQAPTDIPNGAKATKDQMLAAQGKIKAYRAAVEETYLPCLEKEKNDSLATLDAADPEYATKKGAIEAIHAKKHNAALDELTAVAGQWSEEIKAFGAKK